MNMFSGPKPPPPPPPPPTPPTMASGAIKDTQAAARAAAAAANGTGFDDTVGAGGVKGPAVPTSTSGKTLLGQ